jgi:hypothetical protein
MYAVFYKNISHIDCELCCYCLYLNLTSEMGIDLYKRKSIVVSVLNRAPRREVVLREWRYSSTHY